MSAKIVESADVDPSAFIGEQRVIGVALVTIGSRVLPAAGVTVSCISA